MESPKHHLTEKRNTTIDDPSCKPLKRTRSRIDNTQETSTKIVEGSPINRQHVDLFLATKGSEVTDQRCVNGEWKDGAKTGKDTGTRSKLDRDIFEQFALSPQLSDVTFIALNEDDREVDMPAHKVVMCAQSSVFRAMFMGDMRESTRMSKVRVSCPQYIWEMVLQCCYGRKVSIEPQHFIPLLQVADQYDLHCLRQECEAFATIRLFDSKLKDDQTLNLDHIQTDGESFHSGNFFHALEAAILFNAKKIENLCLQAISLHAAEFLHSPYFLELSREAILRILTSSALLGVKEIDLFKRTVSWGRLNAAKGNESLTSAVLSSFLEEPLSLIRYDCMPAKDIYETVYPSSLVRADVLLQSCRSRLLAKDADEGNTHCSPFQNHAFSFTGESGHGSRNPGNVFDIPGVHKQINISMLAGWKLYYCASYSQETLLAQLQPPPNATRVLMAARRKSAPSILELCACCPSACFGKPTLELDEPGLHVHFLGQKINGLYWYCIPDYSVGFSDSPEISINAADIIPGEKRLSWHLGEDSGGGYRCGNCIGLLSPEVSEGGGGENWEKLLFWI